MGQEVELELEVPSSALGEVALLPWLSEMSSGAANTEKLVTVYFDTAKSKLREHGLTLRVRHAGNDRLQTIKALDNGARGAMGRGEWEKRIASDEPDLKLAEGTPLEQLITKKLRRKLKPVFETVVERIAIPVHSGDAELELALDRGHIDADGNRELISEIEIELKRGEPTEIARIAERLAEAVPVGYSTLAKAERGYALSAREAARPVYGAHIELDADTSTGAALATIALSCLNHATSNQRAVREGDPEGVHQMRVGLRRLRAAISVFKELLQGPETEAINTELKWLTEQLGPARDFDVLLEKRVRPLLGAAPIAEDIDVLARDLEAKRARALERAKTAVDSDRYRAIGLRTALWLINGACSSSKDPLTVARRDRPAGKFAAEILAKRSKKISKKIADIEALDARGRHKLRIAVKKLRYACEFFSGLFDGRKRRAQRTRLGRILKSLQGALGTLNDFEMHRRLAATVAHRGKRSRERAEKALAMGFITGQEQQQVAGHIAAVNEIGDRLLQTQKFWK
jgi:inorganic triphosphatase YgiF